MEKWRSPNSTAAQSCPKASLRTNYHRDLSKEAMKKPSIIQLFFAYQWPMKLWLGTFTLGTTLAALAATQPSRTTFSDWRSLLSLLVVVVISLPLGFFLGVVSGSIFLLPLFALREQLSGGPFTVGDAVQILIGPHSGKITHIVSPWQGRSYRVKLDEESEKTFKDIFGEEQLLKEADDES